MITLPLLAASGPNLGDLASQTAAEFGFHWPLFLSQCASFVIVAILLQKFAYRPIIAVLEERRRQIAESLENAEKIRRELAEAGERKAAMLAEATQEAGRIIEEARTAAAAIAERRTQQAVAEAELIVARAREAAAIEREKMLADLRREVGRLVVATTSKVAGRVLTAEDHRRLAEEMSKQMAA